MSREVVADGAGLKTPAGAVLRVPSMALADRIASEWRAYTKARTKARIASKPAPPPQTAMPMYCAAATAIDRVAVGREDIVGELAHYAASELFCYRTDTPAELAERQHAEWQPWLDWLETRYGARLCVHTGLMPARQPAASLAVIRQVVVAADDFRLAAIQQLASLGGSLVAALAVADGHKTADEAFAAVFLDELWQAQRWGSDEAAEVRRAGIKHSMQQAEEFLLLLAGE